MAKNYIATIKKFLKQVGYPNSFDSKPVNAVENNNTKISLLNLKNDDCEKDALALLKKIPQKCQWCLNRAHEYQLY